MIRKIISANYRDRESAFRWLVRDSDQAPSQARACKRVVLRRGDVLSTGDNSQVDLSCERGFGFGVVVSAEECDACGFEFEDSELGAEPDRQASGLRRFIFSLDSFYPATSENGFNPPNAVERFSILALNENGEIWGESEITSNT